MNSLLNIIILSSPIPSNPSTKIIDKAIKSLSLLRYPEDSKIILAHDFPQSESKIKNEYFNYYENLKNKYGHLDNFTLTMSDKFVHMSGNVRNAFNYVDSKYVLILSHDFIFVRDIDIDLIMEDMEKNPQLKHVRFNKRANTHRGGDWESSGKVFDKFSVSGNHEYTSTPCWSDINHISPTSYYKDVILQECRDGGALENFFYCRIKKAYENDEPSLTTQTHEKYGTFLFDKLNAKPYVYHTDGREAFDGSENHDHEKIY